MKPKKIEIMPLGFSISFSLSTNDYNKKIKKGNILEVKKIIVAIAGPLTNIILMIYFMFFSIDIISNVTAIYANLLIVLFNLLPIYPLDGGRILKSLIHILLGGKIAQIVVNKIANILIIVITMIGSIGIYYLKNIAILIIIIFLWGLVIRENRKYHLIMKGYNIK